MDSPIVWVLALVLLYVIFHKPSASQHNYQRPAPVLYDDNFYFWGEKDPVVDPYAAPFVKALRAAKVRTYETITLWGRVLRAHDGRPVKVMIVSARLKDLRRLREAGRVPDGFIIVDQPGIDAFFKAVGLPYQEEDMAITIKNHRGDNIGAIGKVFPAQGPIGITQAQYNQIVGKS